MKLRPILVLLVLLSLVSLAVPEASFTVPVVDLTGAGSSLQVSGSLTLREAARGNELEWSWGQTVTVQNVSGKPILLFAATLSEIGRHTEGQRAAPGDGATYELQQDRFFNEDLINPGEVLTVRDARPGKPDVACCVNPLAATREPKGEFRLRFVQFADGSTFGDMSEGEGALTLRRTILAGLRQLLQSYAEGGKAGFAAELSKQPAFMSTAPCRQISAKFSDSGAETAIEETKRMLAVAEQHSGMIAGGKLTPGLTGN